MEKLHCLNCFGRFARVPTKKVPIWGLPAADALKVSIVSLDSFMSLNIPSSLLTHKIKLGSKNQFKVFASGEEKYARTHIAWFVKRVKRCNSRNVCTET